MSLKIYMVCGIPGAGKSTWLKNHGNGLIVSRDEIRFKMLDEDDEYFDKEKEVFEEFINSIQTIININHKGRIFIDATHLNPISRKKVLSKLKLKRGNELYAIYFDVPLDICLERNNKRTGRSYVPEDVIVDMYNNFVVPTLDEGFLGICKVDENGQMELENSLI